MLNQLRRKYSDRFTKGLAFDLELMRQACTKILTDDSCNKHKYKNVTSELKV